MPRIPVRTEPYSSPSRQHRHFKNKRDQILRALGKSSYINGSQFAIIWVTASGHSETYASDAFQGSLEEWFDNSGIKRQAQQLVKQRSGTSSKRPADLDDDDSRDVFTDDDADDNSVAPEDGTASRRSSLFSTLTAARNSLTPLVACDDVFGDVAGGSSTAVTADARKSAASPGEASVPTFTKTDVSTGSTPPLSSSRQARKPLAPLDVNSANLRFNSIAKGTLPPPITASDDAFLRGPLSAPLPHQPGSHKLRRTQVARLPQASSPLNNLTDILLADRAARTAFFELRFSQMQQGMCKTVAKAWIKIIEPKKQTRCPYNKGEEGKPDWWPVGVRHKEPDHLMKPERHSLLLAILRSPKIKVSRLQLATAEVVAMIKADKVNLLMDVYRVAREEERFREEGKGNAADIPITVGVSTLEGWRVGRDGDKGGLNEEGKLATIAEDSPEDAEKKVKKSVKRRPSTQLSQSTFSAAPASSSSKKLAKQNPRARTATLTQQQQLGGPGPFGTSMQISNSAPHFSMQPAPSSVGLQTAARPSQTMSAGPPSSSTFIDEANFHRSMESLHREVANAAGGPNSMVFNAEGHPRPFDSHVQAYMPGASPMLEPQTGAFTPSMQHSHNIMSAPHLSHVQLLPPRQHASSSISADSSPAGPQYAFNFSGAFGNPFESSAVSSRMGQEQQFLQHNASPFMPQGPAPDAAGPSALGLQGINDAALWTQAFEATNPGVLAPSNGANWNHMSHTASHLHAQQEELLRDPFAAGVPATAPARLTPLPTMGAGDESIGDLTMDQSFASTTTTGPATPPGEARGLGISAATHLQGASQNPSKTHNFLGGAHRFEYSALAAGMYSNASRHDDSPAVYDAWNAGP